MRLSEAQALGKSQRIFKIANTYRVLHQEDCTTITHYPFHLKFVHFFYIGQLTF